MALHPRKRNSSTDPLYELIKGEYFKLKHLYEVLAEVPQFHRTRVASGTPSVMKSKHGVSLREDRILSHTRRF
jgi:hypothetical protein